MGLFGNQFANVVEWEEYRDDILFWKWSNQEIKKGSRLIIRPGQDAIFLYNGKVEGIHQEIGFLCRLLCKRRFRYRSPCTRFYCILISGGRC